jgi:replicative DNA helicase
MSDIATYPKLDLDYYENVILFNSFLNREYLSSIIEHADPSYFNNPNIKIIFNNILSFFKERGTIPSLTEIKARLTTDSEKKAYNDVVNILKGIDTKFNQEELIVNTERFLKERCLYKTIVETAEKYAQGKTDPAETLKEFEKAYNITLSEDIGSWYFEDIDEHIKELTKVYNPIPTGWQFLDERLEGGLFPKTLTCLVGQVNVGKSIFLGNLATNMVMKGKNTLLISLEMSEFMYAKRISAQLTQIPHNELKVYTDELKQQIRHIHKQLESKLIIKEYAPKTITVRHIDGYIGKLKHKGFVPDVVVIDYINLLKPATKNLNSYGEVKEIAEQLRALSFKYSIPFVTASQLTRCLDINTIVITSEGNKKKIKDLKIGDIITGNNGPVTVRHIYPQEKKKVYRIITKTGKQIICSAEHVFPTTEGMKSIKTGLTLNDKLFTDIQP